MLRARVAEKGGIAQCMGLHLLLDPHPRAEGSQPLRPRGIPALFDRPGIDVAVCSGNRLLPEHPRVQRPVLPVFEEKSDDGFVLAERIWSALGHDSQYNPQLRKLLFILYKHLFGVDVPKVYDLNRKEIGIVRLSFEGTPLDLYPAMVNMVYIDKGKETPIIERERRVGR